LFVISGGEEGVVWRERGKKKEGKGDTSGKLRWGRGNKLKSLKKKEFRAQQYLSD